MTEPEALFHQYREDLTKMANHRQAMPLPQPGDILLLGQAFYKVGEVQQAMRERVELQIKFQPKNLLGLDHGCGA